MNKSCRRPPVLVLAAHPDDETLGCGGTIRHLANKGHEIMLITFTDGEGARQNQLSAPINQPTNQPTTQPAAEDRNRLLPQVCHELGIHHYVSGTFPDNQMDSVPLLHLAQFIELQLKQHNFHPKIIFTHHPGCLNIDHLLVYRATMTAFRPQRGQRHEIYSYWVPSSTDYNPLNNFQGNTYFKLTRSEVKAKNAALQIYHDEMRPSPHTRSYDNLQRLVQVWGAEVGTDYAEKFQLIRQLQS